MQTGPAPRVCKLSKAATVRRTVAGGERWRVSTRVELVAASCSSLCIELANLREEKCNRFGVIQQNDPIGLQVRGMRKPVSYVVMGLRLRLIRVEPRLRRIDSAQFSWQPPLGDSIQNWKRSLRTH